MKTYKVKMKNNKRANTIKAKNDLEARVLFCEKKGFNYRHLAGKLEVKDQTGQDKKSH